MKTLLSCCLIVLLASASASTADDATVALERATTALAQFNYDVPRKDFTKARDGLPPGSEGWQQATFGLATCKQQLMPIEAESIAWAVTLFTDLVERCPDSRFTPRAYLNLGRIAELRDYRGDQPDVDTARKHYRTVMTRWPVDSIAGEAAFRLGSSHLATMLPKEFEIGVKVLTDWLSAHPQDPLAAGMWQYLGDCWFQQKDNFSEAYACYQQADAIGLQWRSREHLVWWRMARIAELHIKDNDAAIRYYTKICTDAQTSGKAFEAQIRLSLLGAPIPDLTAFASYTGPRPKLPAPGTLP